MRNSKGQFKPGHSGNPGGRPSGIKDIKPLRTSMQLMASSAPSEEMVAPLEEKLGVSIESNLDLLVATVLNKALSGSYQYTKLYFEYLGGRPSSEPPPNVFDSLDLGNFADFINR